MIRNVHVRRLTPAEKANKPLCQWPVSDKLRARLKELGRADLQWSCMSPAEYLFSAEWWGKRALVNMQEDIVCTAHAAEFGPQDRSAFAGNQQGAERPSRAFTKNLNPRAITAS